jgi:hypothetical protein
MVTIQNQHKFFECKEELLNEAEKTISLAPEGFKDSIKLYFIARYFVVIYESRYGEIPIQVWNEYRNTLDHFFRHLTAGGTVGSEDDAKGHIKKMEGHLQRAALDALKIFSHKTHDSVEKLKEEHNPKILNLVDNGKFIQSINENLLNAEQLFEHAKVSDLELGSDNQKNDVVLGRYLDAAFAFDSLRITLINKAQDIQHARIQYNGIHDHAHKHSFWEGVKIHLMASFIGFLVGSTLTFFLSDIIKNYSSKIPAYFSRQASAIAADNLTEKQEHPKK